MSGDDTPLVSVVVPAYGRPEYLPAAVRSVVEQTYDAVEILVVDDCSPDPIEPTLTEFVEDPAVDLTVVRHPVNRGANAARNTGIEESGGEFVAFLDDDDYWRPEKLERFVDAFERAGPDVGVVYGGVDVVDGDGETVRSVRPSRRGDVTRALLRGENVVGGFSNPVVRRSAVEAAGRTDTRFPSWQDREWYLRLSTHCEFEYVDEQLTVRRMASHGQISDDFERKRDVSFPLFVHKHRSTAAEYGMERRFVAERSRAVAAAAIRTGHFRSAYPFLLRSLFYYPFDWKTYAFLALALAGPSTLERVRRVRRRIGV
ncbi:glycosyltransferase [Halogeometricum sp. S1BR25-6]|uniref:Glycosyltransferase n=1 Tax=Halogeometricum salsisoli TaxID=2950536 RepID=A0ABU2GJ04_9EURY|nr:glycosyltransferase family 2 protein [Halogeometricum sp. S1BR25-6]MDS0300396.1 glycosyltransferase [Halogeometricum sp. S1BR25-6]